MGHVVVPSIEKLGRKLEKQTLDETLDETQRAFELTKMENTDLKLQILANISVIDQQIKDMKMSQRRVQFLEIENRAKDDVLGQQIIDTGVLQYEIQSLKLEIQIKNEALKQYDTEKNIPQRIQVLENEIQSKDDLLKQLTADLEDVNRKQRVMELAMKSNNDALDQQMTNTVNVAHRIHDLEFRNQTNNEELKNMQIQMGLLENENVALKIKAQTEERQFSRTQDALLHLFGKNFVPKLYDKKLDEQFLVFRLNEDNFFTHYAVRSRIRNINQQIKTIRARHPHSVELLRVTFYPNEVNLFKLMRNHLKDKIEFKGNFFTALSDEYSDEDLKTDVLNLFNEAENMRQEVFKMMGIERYFRTNENVDESTEFSDGNNPISANEKTGAVSNTPEQNKTSKTSEEVSTQDSEIANAVVEGGNPDQESDLKSARGSEILGNDQRIINDVD